jgi:hypothetical protein
MDPTMTSTFFVRVLRERFGARDDGEITGPYSIHRYMNVSGPRFGIIGDSPEWLDLYADEDRHEKEMTAFVATLLIALNESST